MDLDQAKQLLELLAVPLALIGVITYYFGRIIADSKVEEFDKFGSQLEGLFFVLLYLGFPLTILYALYDKLSAVSGIDPVIVEVVAFLVVIAIFNLKLQQRIRYLNGEEEKSTKLEWLLTNRTTLMAVAFVVLAPLALEVNKFMAKPVLDFVFALLLIMNMSLIAITYGLATVRYPRSQILLTSGKSVPGRIVKFEKDFVNIIDRNKQTFVSKAQIQYIEQERNMGVVAPPNSGKPDKKKRAA